MFPFSIITSKLRERRKAKTRSSHWPTVRDRHLKLNPTCAACGSRRVSQVHHVVPFALDASRELDPANLLTLCEWISRCHLKLGHGGSFDCYNPRVRGDADTSLLSPKMRRVVRMSAKQSRTKLA